MKWLFILLLTLNVGYLAWEIDNSSAQHRQNQQQAISVPANATRLSLVSELQQQPATRTASSSEQNYAAVVPDEPVLPIAMNPNTENMVQTLLNDANRMELENGMLIDNMLGNTDPAGEDLPPVCYTYGPIPDSVESDNMSNWLQRRSIRYTQRQTGEPGQQKFWIYLSPRGSREQAVAALKDLRQKGIEDLHLVNKGDLSNAVSLGLYSTQAAVNRRLAEIKATGYQPIVVPYSAGKQVYWFDVIIRQNAAYVDELFTGLPARFNAVPVACDEIAMLSGNP